MFGKLKRLERNRLFRSGHQEIAGSPFHRLLAALVGRHSTMSMSSLLRQLTTRSFQSGLKCIRSRLQKSAKDSMLHMQQELKMVETSPITMECGLASERICVGALRQWDLV